MLFIILFFILHWYFSLFFQTFFHHRYSAHQMFSMKPVYEKVFYFLSWVFQGSSYLSPYVYGALHRMHHAYADTEADPHSPKYDPNLMAMMWRTRTIYKKIDIGEIKVEDRFTKNLPEWRSFDRFASHYLVRFLWIGVYVMIYAMFAPVWWVYVLIPLHAIMGPLHGVIINWFAHKYGYTNFKLKDTSKNLLPFDFLMLGESYHNNHHRHASRANFGFRWHEFDPVYPVILLLDKLKVIRLKPKNAIAQLAVDPEVEQTLAPDTRNKVLEKA